MGRQVGGQTGRLAFRWAGRKLGRQAGSQVVSRWAAGGAQVGCRQAGWQGRQLVKGKQGGGQVDK